MTWEWKNGTRGWRAYSSEVNDAIKLAASKRVPSFEIDLPGLGICTINLQKNRQIRKSNKQWRYIRYNHCYAACATIVGKYCSFTLSEGQQRFALAPNPSNAGGAPTKLPVLSAPAAHVSEMVYYQGECYELVDLGACPPSLSAPQPLLGDIMMNKPAASTPSATSSFVHHNVEFGGYY
jgi:hypothetical protein